MHRDHIRFLEANQDLQKSHQRYGQIDILVNNAGYGIFEDFTCIDQQVRRCLKSIGLCPHAYAD